MERDIENDNKTATDGNVITAVLKNMDANSYATKKTIAQGLLDVALLTANAAQLKYILQVGQQHEFYALMLGLIITSIVLQGTAGLLSVFIATLKIHEDEQHNLIAAILNHIALGFVTGALFCDIIKMNFGLDPAIAVNLVQVVFCIFLGSKLNINKEGDQDNANIANNFVLCINALLVGVNVFISAFEMKEDFADTSTSVTVTTTESLLKM